MWAGQFDYYKSNTHDCTFIIPKKTTTNLSGSPTLIYESLKKKSINPHRSTAVTRHE